MPRRNLANRLHDGGGSPYVGILLFSMLAIVGCGSDTDPAADSTAAQSPLASDSPATGTNADPSSGELQFQDEVESNREDDGTLSDLEFYDTEGNKVRVDQYLGEKHVLLVFTRGFNGSLCPFCTTQTSRLIANYEKFVERDTEVLLVYPGRRALDEFTEVSIRKSQRDSFPFPVLLDENLVAVKRLKIAEELAYPSSFIIDKKGNVSLAYVGKSPNHRPSIKALLERLDSLQE